MRIKTIDEKANHIKTLENLLPIAEGDQKRAILRELSNLKKGHTNEKNVAYFIDRAFANKQNTIVLHDLRLEYGGYISQIDHLLINVGGIFLLESKYFSQTLEIDENGNWIAKYGKHTYTIPSPIEQNRRHIYHLQKIFEAYELIPKRLGIKVDLPFYHYVLVNTSCLLKGNIPDNVIKAESIESTIDEHWDKEADKYFWLNTFKIVANLITHNEMSKIVKTLLKLHRPFTPDYTKKFGIEAPKADQQLLTKLIAKRVQMAKEAQVTPAAILDDQTLRLLAALKPQTPNEIQSIPTITRTKYAQYGYKFLNLILAHQSALARKKASVLQR